MDFRHVVQLFLIFGLFACGVNGKQAEKQNVEIHFQINEAKPYCGGAAPNPEMEIPKRMPLPACSLSVHGQKKDGSRGKVMALLITDAQGHAHAHLPAGKYQLWRPSKLYSFETFLKMERKDFGVFYQVKDESCFQFWYEQPDFSFEIGDQREFEFEYTSGCFIGIHPCLDYTGPLPP